MPTPAYPTSYYVGLVIGSAVLVGVISAIVTRLWKRPMLASLATGLLAAAVFYVSTRTVGVQYIVAGAIWGAFWSWRDKKGREKVSAAVPPVAP